jgi:hypothetical protein
LGEINRRRVWVDGIEYDGPPPKPCAAELAVMGLKEPEKREREAVPPEPPLPESGEPEAEEDLSIPPGRMPLLRYPPAEGPLYRGSRRWK